MSNIRKWVLAVSILLPMASCSSPPETIPATPLGEPLPGLRPAELARFRQGEALFNRVYTPAEGVGPLFNENQCSACHTKPVAGGTGEQFLIKATRFTHPADCDLLRSEGGENVRTQATPLLLAHGINEEPFPARATERGKFSVPFLFGLGLVEEIPAETILEREDSADADGDGISGRAARDSAGVVGRFSRKADILSIEGFVGTALRFEMGLTTPLAPHDLTIAGSPLPEGTDPAPDPEVNQRTVELLTDYVRFLAPPARRIPGDPDAASFVAQGEEIFKSIGCSSCHVPSMATGDSDIPALDNKEVYLYSDLLLHDLGPGLASTCGYTASPRETRTEMLMGLGRRDRYLHDDRAFSLRDAIMEHGGEAAPVRARFAALGRLMQESLIRFLESL